MLWLGVWEFSGVLGVFRFSCRGSGLRNLGFLGRYRESRGGFAVQGWKLDLGLRMDLGAFRVRFMKRALNIRKSIARKLG